jgi:hypothetical protein
MERVMGEGAGERLTLIFVVGILLLNFPILAIFNQATPFWGIPILFLYLFGLWGAGIVAAWMIGRRK